MRPAAGRGRLTLPRGRTRGRSGPHALTIARGPLGAVQERTLQAAHPATELPGAPDGEYVVFEFQTRFERKRAAIETVSPMRDRDGQWRVSGYYIR